MCIHISLVATEQLVLPYNWNSLQNGIILAHISAHIWESASRVIENFRVSQ